MSFWGVGRHAAAVVVALLLVAGCSNAEAEDPGGPSPSASAEASETPAGASAEAAQDGGASAEADGSSSGGDKSEPPSPDPNRPEAQLPKRPAAMDEHTVEGAIAAGKYFVQLYPYIYATGDLNEWNALSDDGCEFCNSAQKRAGSIHTAGGYTVGGEVEIDEINGGGPYEENAYIVEFDLRFAPTELVEKDSTRTKYDADDRPDFTVSLAWREGAWMVTGVLVDGVDPEKQ